jgi:hypothetical protein
MASPSAGLTGFTQRREAEEHGAAPLRRTVSGMDRDAAIKLANDWHELAETETASSGYNQVSQTLRTLLPNIAAGGAAIVDDVPTVLALDGTNVFAVSADASGEAQPTARVRRLPLAPERISVTLLDNPAGSLSEGKIPAHLRAWTFRWDSGEVLAVHTVVKVHNGWKNEPSSGEGFAQALAAALGWEVSGSDR